MYELVELKNNEVFTNSKVIAEGTGNLHSSIQKIINTDFVVISQLCRVA